MTRRRFFFRFRSFRGSIRFRRHFHRFTLVVRFVICQYQFVRNAHQVIGFIGIFQRNVFIAGAWECRRYVCQCGRCRVHGVFRSRHIFKFWTFLRWFRHRDGRCSGCCRSIFFARLENVFRCRHVHRYRWRQQLNFMCYRIDGCRRVRRLVKFGFFFYFGKWGEIEVRLILSLHKRLLCVYSPVFVCL